MFEPSVYSERRKRLGEEIKNGIVLLPGNMDSPMNYPSNAYHFRQDSSFLYFFGIDQPGMAGIIDIDSNEDLLFGDDTDLESVIWMGPQPSVKELGLNAGTENTYPYKDIEKIVNNSLKKGRKVHFLPPYRAENKIFLEKLTGIHYSEIDENISEDLIKAVVKLRSVKEPCEIAEIEKAVDVAYEMHTTAMKMAVPGTYEKEIAGRIEGISLSHGTPVSFPVILTINGHILHNHYHGNMLREGRMMVTDAGHETSMRYASDITRSVPVGGKFSQRQKDIYEIVFNALIQATGLTRPGVPNRDVHLEAAAVIAAGLKDIGLMKGDIREAVNRGAHALFFPHGLGHMMGLDVHDMEGLGEDFVGYDEEIKRSEIFGLKGLRLGRRLREGFVLTIEPGLYFIPPLIDKWRSEKRFTDFINYDKVESYKDFGGIRIEDNVLVTGDGCRLLGKPVPKTVREIEETMSK